MENGWNLEDSYGQVIAQTQQCRVTQNEADRKTAYLLFPWKTFFFSPPFLNGHQAPGTRQVFSVQISEQIGLC